MSSVSDRGASIFAFDSEGIIVVISIIVVSSTKAFVFVTCSFSESLALIAAVLTIKCLSNRIIQVIYIYAYKMIAFTR